MTTQPDPSETIYRLLMREKALTDGDLHACTREQLDALLARGQRGPGELRPVHVLCRITDGDQLAWVADRSERPMAFGDAWCADAAAFLFCAIGIDAVAPVPVWRGYLPPGTTVIDGDERAVGRFVSRVLTEYQQALPLAADAHGRRN